MVDLLLYVPLGALTVSVGANIWQVHDRRQARRPHVELDVNAAAGAPSWPDRREGMFTGDDASALYLAGTIHVAGSAIIKDARLVPAAQKRVKWDSLPEPDVYVGDPSEPDSGRREGGMGIAQIPDEEHLHRLPQPVTDAQLVIRVELPAVRLGMRLDAEARILVLTETGHTFSSPPGLLRERFRGLSEPARQAYENSAASKPPFSPELETGQPPHEQQ